MKRIKLSQTVAGARILTTVGAGRCHEELEVVAMKTRAATVREKGGTYQYDEDFEGGRGWNKFDRICYELEQNEALAGILWAGGWDDYVVDTSTIRPMTEAETAEMKRQIAGRSGVVPVNNGWLLGYFAKGLCKDNEMVKIVGHIGGGD